MITTEQLISCQENIALVGLGYVGLPLAVAHDQFKFFDAGYLARLCAGGYGSGVAVDVKGLFCRSAIESAGLRYWSL